ncbi:MAG: glutamate---cysteine ligase / carboxylate-amine ligase [Solirubrobacteraceae bacterium]|nr:glutamate---cysteine ligase / carboxylate-amine ligase [Solirubrobacteraceae bacterium]
MSAGPARPRFGAGPPFALGVEDELLLVDPRTHRLANTAVQVLDALDVPAEEGTAKPDTYAAMIELTSPVSPDATAAVAAIARLRARVRETGAAVVGAGVHPDGPFGDVVHYPAERYQLLERMMRGLLRRTPTAALHVHVGMPDAEAAIRAANGLREHLPVLGALAANSPFWHGRDSGMASARSSMFRGYRGAELPRAFASYDDYAETIAATVAAGDLPDYTFLYWDVRPHPKLGTVEVRAMDGQSALWAEAGLAALVHALARREAERPGPWTPREALVEASFAAARDGLDARLPMDGALRPAREVVAATLELARPHARDLGSEDALAGVERILAEGNGADRQRAAFARGGMDAVLHLLVAEAEADLRRDPTGTRRPGRRGGAR